MVGRVVVSQGREVFVVWRDSRLERLKGCFFFQINHINLQKKVINREGAGLAENVLVVP